MSKNRVLFGLTNVHYAVITREDDGSYTYATPVRVEGAVSLEMNPTGDPMNFYADNGVFFSRNSNTGYEGTLTIAMITDKFRTDVLGEKMINGGFLESADAKPKDIALLFEVDGDAQATRFVYYDVTVARPSQSAQTTAESIKLKDKNYHSQQSHVLMIKQSVGILEKEQKIRCILISIKQLLNQ